ncbi:MAG: methylmalonyl Co-A mutase-associated GTPase MeaB [Candidatus Marinimicrobia bacterium]|nr:methylmalonyl Co-A mutase-associated GTPase MeaB [Candidatus Neomarinimicrobiota bacterium]MBL7059377.1 methylmalonyl Co-A mutase-associated GTPase MeaB [Candidatus Neomarinimicrobiota bacterium]
MRLDPDSIRNNHHRVISKAITHIENSNNLIQDILIDLHPDTLNAVRIGITGPPGAGKSTLVNHLISDFVRQGKSVGVVAVDPTSPFTGGALLGDRVRMNRHLWDENVFIRSMGSHGDLGGLARKTQDVGDLLAASGKEIIIYETVGVGQGEHDIAKAADITVVVLVPESGDEIQLMKAGLIEIADFFVINKSDRDGAGRLSQMLRVMLHTFAQSRRLEPPVMNTVARKGEGVLEFKNNLLIHLERMKENGYIHRKRLERHRRRVIELVQHQLLDEFWTSQRMKEFSGYTETEESIETSPFVIAKELLKVQ